MPTKKGDEMKVLPFEYEEVSKIFDYDAETGDIFRLPHRKSKRRRRVGYRISNPQGKMYIFVYLGDKAIPAHRLAWILGNKQRIPDGMVIDHINGDAVDNRLINLRAVTNAMNSQNRKGPTSINKSGFLGVWKAQRSIKCWMATIKVNGKSLHLGPFESKEEAHEAYMDAKCRLHPGCEIWNQRGRNQ